MGKFPEQLRTMADMVERLEAQGAAILCVDIPGEILRKPPRIHLSRFDLPSVVESRRQYLCGSGAYTQIGYTEAGVTVFWMVDRGEA